MRNRLTLCSMVFALLLVGKIGGIGTLGKLSWLWVLLPIVLDSAMDFTIAMGYQDYFVQYIIYKVKYRKMNKAVKDAAVKFKGI